LSGDRLEAYGKGKNTHVKTFFAIVLTLGLLAATGFAQPTVTLIVNAASSSRSPLPNSSIAQGSYFTIYGNNFGPASSVCSATPASCYWSPYPLPTTIEGTSASVTVGTTVVPVYMEFAEQLNGYSQINAVLPSNTPTGTGTLAVTYNGTASATSPITVVASSFGTFAWDEAGSGPGIFTNAVSNQLLTPFASVKPGDYVTIWGTGLGPAPNVSTEATKAPTPTNLCGSGATCPVTVWVGGQQATVTYAGRSGFTAEDQIDFVVPASAQGCYVQVAVEIDSVVGNFTSLPVDPNGATCQDDDGINYGDIASVVQSKGQANVGDIIMLSNYLNLSIPLLGSLQWDNDTVAAGIGTYTTRALESFQGFALAPSVNNCSVTPFLQFPPPVDPAVGLVTFLDAGASLSMQGPNGSQTLAKGVNGGYGGVIGGETINELITGCPATSTNQCAPFFLSPAFAISAGTYTVTSPGTSAVGALSAPITVTPAAAAFKWTNQSTVTAGAIPRDTPLTITWSGGDPNGFVDITAIASTLASGLEPSATTPGILVECIAKASDGTFTIPIYVLQSLPSTVNSTATVPPGELLVGPVSGAVKATPPAGLDALYIVYHYIQGQNVSWQ
jgi:uncharacterized protein (TIGR03437 family)